jgi:hypothetical protein
VYRGRAGVVDHRGRQSRTQALQPSVGVGHEDVSVDQRVGGAAACGAVLPQCRGHGREVVDAEVAVAEDRDGREQPLGEVAGRGGEVVAGWQGDGDVGGAQA